MAITPSYIPTSGQVNAATRAAALGVGLASSVVPPVYAAAVAAGGGAPGVVAEYGSGMVVFEHDDGTLSSAQVTALIAPLVAAQTAAQTLQANQATTLSQLLTDLNIIGAWLVNNPNGAVLNAAQTRVLARLLFNVTLAVAQDYATAPVTT